MQVRKPLLAIGACAVLMLSSSCSRDSDAKQTRTYQLGERIQLGPFIYSVFETQWLNQLGEGSSARIPRHRFFLVRISVTNAGSNDGFTPPLVVVDSKGTAYTELSNGEGVPNWIGSLRQIKPANSAQGNVVFDVPPANYKLKIGDESEQHVGLVDIPLSFDSPAPAVAPSAGELGTDDTKGQLKSPR